MNRSAIRVRAQVHHVVGVGDSAAAWGNELPVLATPVLLWLAEIACMEALSDALEPGEMTVGIEHVAEHLAPTPVGATVRCVSRLSAVAGRRLIFEVEASDGRNIILRGAHTRAVVDRDEFQAKVSALSEEVGS